MPSERGEGERDEEPLRPGEGGTGGTCCGPAPAPAQRRKGGERDEREHDALRVLHRERVTERKHREICSRAARGRLLEQLLRECVERHERAEEADVGEHEPSRRISQAEHVEAAHEHRVERKERGIALAARHQQVAAAGDHAVPAAVPRLERTERVRVLDEPDPAVGPEVVNGQRGEDDQAATAGPPRSDPREDAQPLTRSVRAPKRGRPDLLERCHPGICSRPKTPANAFLLSFYFL